MDTEDQDRKAFEEAVTIEGMHINLSRIGPASENADEYADVVARTCWHVWQLALAYDRYNGIISRFIGGVEYLNTTQSAKMLGYSGTGMHNLLDRYEAQKKADPSFVDPLPVHVFGPPPAPSAKRDTRPRYIKRSDLDEYVKPK